MQPAENTSILKFLSPKFFPQPHAPTYDYDKTETRSGKRQIANDLLTDDILAEGGDMLLPFEKNGWDEEEEEEEKRGRSSKKRVDTSLLSTTQVIWS